MPSPTPTSTSASTPDFELSLLAFPKAVPELRHALSRHPHGIPTPTYNSAQANCSATSSGTSVREPP